jgi:hypothetical protein
VKNYLLCGVREENIANISETFTPHPQALTNEVKDWISRTFGKGCKIFNLSAWHHS